MAVRKKSILTYNEIADQELQLSQTPETTYPLDVVQQLIADIQREQEEAHVQWVHVGRIVLNERKRSTLIKNRLERLEQTVAQYGRENKILMRYQRELSKLEAQALAIWNLGSTLSPPASTYTLVPKQLLPIMGVKQGGSEKEPEPSPPGVTSHLSIQPIKIIPDETSTPSGKPRTLAAKKHYRCPTSPDTSDEDQLKIDEDYRPHKKTKKEGKPKKDRRTSTGSHHSSKQGRVGGRFVKKIDTASTSSTTAQIHSTEKHPVNPELIVEPRESAIVLPREPEPNYLKSELLLPTDEEPPPQWV